MKKISVLSFLLFYLFLALLGMNADADEITAQPVLLWEREFNPPIREISDQNSDGNFIAIQLDKDASHPQKIIVIDSVFVSRFAPAPPLAVTLPNNSLAVLVKQSR